MCINKTQLHFTSLVVRIVELAQVNTANKHNYITFFMTYNVDERELLFVSAASRRYHHSVT